MSYTLAMNGDQGLQAEAQRLAEGIYEDSLLDRCAYLEAIGFWDGNVAVRPAEWLENFSDADDRRHAVHLLAAMQYYGLQLCRALVVDGLRRAVEAGVREAPTAPGSAYADAWEAASMKLIVSAPAGAGDRFGSMVAETALDAGLRYEDLSTIGAVGERAERILIVDCTGPSVDDDVSAFREVAAATDSEARVVALFASPSAERGTDADLVVHVLPSLYAIDGANSVVWPAEMQETGPQFVQSVRQRLGMPGRSREGQTAVVLGHRIPEVVDPILWSSSDNYSPLLVVNDGEAT